MRWLKRLGLEWPSTATVRVAVVPLLALATAVAPAAAVADRSAASIPSVAQSAIPSSPTTTDLEVRPFVELAHKAAVSLDPNAVVAGDLEPTASISFDPVRGPAPKRGATAEISDVGRGFRGNQVVDRIAAEAEGALSQANRMLKAGNRSTPWSRFYQRVRGSRRWYEDLARRNALHQLAEAQVSRSRYVLEARRAGYIVEFNKGSALGLRGARNGLLRPDIQIGIPGGRWGVVDWTTPGSARKIFNYQHPLAPFLINVTLP